MNNFDGLSSSLASLEKQLEEVQQMLGIDAKSITHSTEIEHPDVSIDENTAAELLKRIKHLEDTEIPALRADCDAIIVAKKDLLNAYKTIGMQNRRQLMSLQVAAGVTQMPSDGPFTSLLSMMNSWDKEESTPQNGNSTYNIVKSNNDKKNVNEKTSSVPAPSTNTTTVITNNSNNNNKKKRSVHSFEEM